MAGRASKWINHVLIDVSPMRCGSLSLSLTSVKEKSSHTHKSAWGTKRRRLTTTTAATRKNIGKKNDIKKPKITTNLIWGLLYKIHERIYHENKGARTHTFTHTHILSPSAYQIEGCRCYFTLYLLRRKISMLWIVRLDKPYGSNEFGYLVKEMECQQ